MQTVISVFGGVAKKSAEMKTALRVSIKVRYGKRDAFGITVSLTRMTFDASTQGARIVSAGRLFHCFTVL